MFATSTRQTLCLQPTASPARRTRFASRRTLLTMAGAAVCVASLVGGATAASAMSPYVQTASVRPGDCVVTAGAHYDGTRGWAIGAGTVTCAYRHASTTLTVRLWRWNGVQWTYFPSTVRSTTFTNSYGFGNRELDSGPVCGGGYTQWVTEVDYTISGVGSGWVENASQSYAPGAC